MVDTNILLNDTKHLQPSLNLKGILLTSTPTFCDKVRRLAVSVQLQAEFSFGNKQIPDV